MKVVFLTTDARKPPLETVSKFPCLGTAPAALLEGFSSLREIELHVISCTQAHFPTRVRVAANIWFHSLYVPKWGWLKSGYSGCILRVRKALTEIRPDIVHAQGTERDCAISALSFRGPKLLTLHGNVRRVAKVLKAPPFSYWWLQARIENWVLPKYDGVICLSHHAQRQVARRARKTWIVPNAVDPSFFVISRARVAPARVLCVATISPLKNQLGLIRALETYPFPYPFELHFFGGLDRGSNYGKDFLQALSRNSLLYYGGVLNRPSLKMELSRACALILPTFEENCPMTILEAQAAGVPVIASNVGGVPDLIQDGRTGIMTDPEQPETMSKALARLLGDPELAKRLANEGRIQAKTRFHPKVIASKHLEIYQEVIASR